MENDLIKVEDTSAEALVSKISAIKKGYFNDPYAQIFYQTSTKKDVIINRGYWSRYEAFKMMIYTFLLNGGGKKNILSLGCGYDTMFFNLISDSQFKECDFEYFEIDLPIVIKNKIKKIAASKILLNLLEDIEIKDDFISSKKYKLFSCDITNIEDLNEKLEKNAIDKNIPTLIFSECVLAYIETKSTSKLLDYLLLNYKYFYFLDYEMFNPLDNFGKIMIKNFESKGCPLIGIYDYPTLESIKNRFILAGFDVVDIFDMLTIYNFYLYKEEKKRIEKIEWFDEFEEWNLMQSHYFFCFLRKIDPKKKETLNDNEKILLEKMILNKK